MQDTTVNKPRVHYLKIALAIPWPRSVPPIAERSTGTSNSCNSIFRRQALPYLSGIGWRLARFDCRDNSLLSIKNVVFTRSFSIQATSLD